MTKGRIEYLDGCRGLAILLVIFYHAYARWPDVVPYGDRYANFPIAKYGWLGVELFFLISGFVILMTLERCSSAKEFLFRRWLRLFPAMLVCTVLVFATSGFFYERPAGSPTWESLLPGLFFVEPGWWGRVLGHKIEALEGSFWSLFVEFKFYLFAALFYYWRGRNILVVALVSAFVGAIFSGLADRYLGWRQPTVTFLFYKVFSFQLFGWFASGAAFYIYSKNRSARWLVAAIVIAVASAVAIGEMDLRTTIAACFISFVFAVAVLSERARKILSNPLFLFFGFVSYPLYLIHENMMVSIVSKLDHLQHVFPEYLLMVPAVLVLSGIALFVARYCEPRVKAVVIVVARTLSGLWRV